MSKVIEVYRGKGQQEGGRFVSVDRFKSQNSLEQGDEERMSIRCKWGNINQWRRHG